MKKLMAFVIFMLAFLTIKTYADFDKDCWIHLKVDTGNGTYFFNKEVDGNPAYCGGIGTTCKVVPCGQQLFGKITPVTGGWLFRSHLQTATLNVQDSTGNWSLYTRTGNNFPFVPNESFRIDICLDIPELVGLTVSLGGIVTDDSGNYLVFIPNGGE